MKYNLGDRVWYAGRKSVEKYIKCPDCAGDKYLTVIMGDGSEVTIECVGCRIGYDPPRGYVVYYENVDDVRQVIITRVEASSGEVAYGFESNYRALESRFFDTQDEAINMAKELAEEENRQELLKIHSKERDKRSWAWNAHYHRREIKDLTKRIAYHQSKLDVAQKKAKVEVEQG